MASPKEFRLYTFVAGLYLSELQKGLQTAHVVSQIAHESSQSPASPAATDFQTWASQDKTIIICNAHNHKGVLDCWVEIERLNSSLGLAAAIFFEDEQSMNGMATACGVIVPKEYWDVVFESGVSFGGEERWVHRVNVQPDGTSTSFKAYDLSSPVGQFISHIKQYRLA